MEGTKITGRRGKEEKSRNVGKFKILKPRQTKRRTQTIQAEEEESDEEYEIELLQNGSRYQELEMVEGHQHLAPPPEAPQEDIEDDGDVPDEDTENKDKQQGEHGDTENAPEEERQDPPQEENKNQTFLLLEMQRLRQREDEDEQEARRSPTPRMRTGRKTKLLEKWKDFSMETSPERSPRQKQAKAVAKKRKD